MSTQAADRRGLRPSGLSPALAAKYDRIMAVKAQRDGLRRVKEAARRIQAELKRMHAAKRAASVGDGEEGWLLTEIKRLRFDLDQLEV